MCPQNLSVHLRLIYVYHQADDEFPPPPPMRSADSSLNDSSHLNDSNSTTQSNVTSECSEAECDREPLVKDSRGKQYFYFIFSLDSCDSLLDYCMGDPSL
jgi:hypothetical protein